MEAVDDQENLPVHSLVRRSMRLISQSLGDVPSHGNERLHLVHVVGLLLSSAMHPTVRSLRAIEHHSAGEDARVLTGGRKIVPRSTLSDALARFDPEALRPVIQQIQARLPWLKRVVSVSFTVI